MKYLALFTLVICLSCQVSESLISKHVAIDVYSYKYENVKKGAAMPEIKSTSKLKKYSRRFEYLLINCAEINSPEATEERNEIFGLYPRKAQMKKLYLEKYIRDQKLNAWFEETIAPINSPGMEITRTYTSSELMEVASKFFYCDEVLEDTTVQAHVCIGLNGIKEAQWDKDYTLLAAFCYEAVFSDFDQEPSVIWESFIAQKREACQELRPGIKSLDQYLSDVRTNLFERMKNDENLRKKLLIYVEQNKSNLAFRIVD